MQSAAPPMINEARDIGYLLSSSITVTRLLFRAQQARQLILGWELSLVNSQES